MENKNKLNQIKATNDQSNKSNNVFNINQQFPTIEKVRAQSEEKKLRQKVSQKRKQSTPKKLEKFNQKKKYKKYDFEISPELAAAVIQQYLLPMFDNYERALKDQNRSFEFGIKEKQIQAQLKEFHFSELTTEPDSRPKSKTGASQKSQIQLNNYNYKGTTVYDELRLSDKLMQELRTARLELCDVQQKLQDSEQANYIHQQKAKEYQAKCTEIEIKLRIYKQNYETLFKEQQQSQKALNHLKEQLNLVQIQLKESNKCRLFLSEQINNQNKDLENKEISLSQLKNNNDVLKMEKEIISEQFTVLISNFGQLSTRQFMDITVKEQLNYIMQTLTQTVKLYEGVISQLDSTKRENSVFDENMKYIMKIRKEMLIEYEKQQVEIQKKVQNLLKEHELVTEQRDTYMEQNLNYEKNNKNLNSTVEKLRQKIQNYRKKNFKFLETNLKTCKNCNSEYFENENFN